MERFRQKSSVLCGVVPEWEVLWLLELCVHGGIRKSVTERGGVLCVGRFSWHWNAWKETRISHMRYSRSPLSAYGFVPGSWVLMRSVRDGDAPSPCLKQAFPVIAAVGSYRVWDCGLFSNF